MSFHPSISGTAVGDEEGWEQVMQAQQMFMNSRDRQRPAATVVAKTTDADLTKATESLPTTVDKDYVTLDGGVLPMDAPTLTQTDAGGSLPMEKPDVVDVLCDVMERQHSPSVNAFAPPSFCSIGWPKTYHRKNGPSLAQKKEAGSRDSVSNFRKTNHFAEQLERERQQQQELSSGVDDIDKHEMHHENLQRLAAMTSDEIVSARKELESSLDPSILALIRKRAAKKGGKIEGAANPDATNGKSSVENTDAKNPSHFVQAAAEQQMTPPVSAIGRSVGSDGWANTVKQTDKILSIIKTDEDIDKAVETHLPRFEQDKLAWTKPVGAKKMTKKKTSFFQKPPRFDLNGVRVLLKTEEHTLGPGEREATQLRYVGVKDGDEEGLYHHGEDQDTPGYTVGELVHLSRSVVSGQRLTALRALTLVLERRRDAIEGKSGSQTSPCPNKLPNDLPKVLMVCLQSDVSGIMCQSIQAVYAWLVPTCFVECQGANPTYRSHEAWPFVYHAQKLEGDFSTSAVADPYGDTFLAAEKDGEETLEGLLVKLSEQDPVRWCMRCGILESFARILRTGISVLPVGIARDALDTLSYMASHSIPVARAMWTHPQLINVIQHTFLEGNGSVLHNAIRFIRTLAQSDREIAEKVAQDQGLADTVKRYLLAPASVAHQFPGPASGDNQESHLGAMNEWYGCAIETLQLWRVCLEYGFDIENFLSMREALRDLMHYPEEHSQKTTLQSYIYALCTARCFAFNSSPRVVDGVSIVEGVQVELEYYLKDAILLVEQGLAGDSVDVDVVSWGARTHSPLHFIASYCSCNFPVSRWSSKILSLIFQGHKSFWIQQLASLNSGSARHCILQSADEKVISALHGYVRCIEAMIIYESSGVKSALQIHGRALVSTLLRLVDHLAHDSCPPHYLKDRLAPYAARAHVQLVASIVDLLTRIFQSDENLSFETVPSALPTMFDASFAVMSKVLPGDECIFANLLTHLLRWACVDKGVKVDQDDIKLYYASYLGDERAQKHSMSLVRPSVSDPIQSCAVAPRSEKSIPSVLRLPRQWLWLGMTTDGKATEHFLKSCIYLVHGLEQSRLLNLPKVTIEMPPSMRIYCMLQIFLRGEGAFVNDEIVQQKIVPLLDSMLPGVTVDEFLETCGTENCMELVKGLKDAFFLASFGHTMFSRCLLFLSQNKDIRVSIFRAGVKTRMLALLENGVRHGNAEGGINYLNEIYAQGTEDSAMVDLYCAALTSRGVLTKAKAPLLYAFVVNQLKRKIDSSSPWVGSTLKERLVGFTPDEIW